MTYIYIAAYRELTEYDDEPSISFKHVKIEALNEKDAYAKGWLAFPRTFDDFVNDYVIKVG